MIYLDNNATTQIDPVACAAMEPFLREHFWNASSSYTAARPVRQALDKARSQCAALLGCEEREIIFTSGGTEANNTAIHSALALHPERRHIITCATEHDAVLNYCKHMEHSAGYTLTMLPVDAHGIPSLAELAAAIIPGQTALISLMWANNETGVISPIHAAATLASEHGILFHTDAVQAGGKLPMALNVSPVHYLALSGHKFHAPKGVGLLYVNKRVSFLPWMLGGGQEGQRRAGTENVASIVALGQAAESAHAHISAQPAGEDPIAALRDYFETALHERVTGIHFHGASSPRTPNTTNFHIEGTEAAAMMIVLDKLGVYVSAGSACHTGSQSMSPVLSAMGLTPEQGRQTLRVSLSRFTTRPEIDTAIEQFVLATAKVRATLGTG